MFSKVTSHVADTIPNEWQREQRLCMKFIVHFISTKNMICGMNPCHDEHNNVSARVARENLSLGHIQHIQSQFT